MDFGKKTFVAFPALYVAEADIDGDGYNEIFAKLTEATEEEDGLYCIKNKLGVQECPHFVIQDRNIAGDENKLENFKVMGPIYGYFVGLTINDRFGKYSSLVAYKDTQFKTYSLWQYDRKTDKYYNVERP
jgi:hypothetical protein